ncbi:MAG: response regulator transcription factor [Verrucomicrobiae bacterium]|nr:response regulator transcription factor [Verrucomicrobiae bacterium]
MNLLLVEDDAELARQLVAELGRDEWRVSVECNGKEGLTAAKGGRWDLLILDVSLPGMSGVDLVSSLRSENFRTPVLFLSAKGEVHDRVLGLSRGGDDYLTKPFAMDELRARIEALLRRSSLDQPSPRSLPEGWELDSLQRYVIVRGHPVPLQPREWSLLKLFLDHEGSVLTNSFLLDQVWGIHFDPGTNVVNATLCRLRRKLDEPDHPSYFETIRGRGHVFRRHA